MGSIGAARSDSRRRRPRIRLAWSPDGSTLATGAIHFPAANETGPALLPGVVRLWDRNGRLVRTLGTDRTGGKFLKLAWSPDGTMLAAGAVDYRVWRADGTDVGVPRPGGTPAWAMAWSPDGADLALGDENGTLDIVTPTGSVLTRRVFSGGVNSTAYAPNGSRTSWSRRLEPRS
jgi:WD40 repeat protein